MTDIPEIVKNNTADFNSEAYSKAFASEDSPRKSSQEFDGPNWNHSQSFVLDTKTGKAITLDKGTQEPAVSGSGSYIMDGYLEREIPLLISLVISLSFTSFLIFTRKK